jgi:Tol biopolymer transport system component
VLLPDGRHIVYLAVSHDTPESPENELRVAALDGSSDLPVVASVANAAAFGSYLLYLRGNTLMAQVLDADQGELTGEAQIVGRDVYFDGDTWRAAFSAAADLLVYQSSPGDRGSRIDLIDLSGRELGQLGEPGPYEEVAVSPDGQYLAVTIGAPSDLWIVELASGLQRRLTFAPGAESSPVWSVDGEQVFYRAWTAENPARVMAVPASGAGDPRVIFEDPELFLRPFGITPDGRELLLGGLLADRQGDLWRLDLSTEGPPVPIIDRPRSQNTGAVSPDGRWIAYSSDESGQFQIFVEPFSSSATAPLRAGRWQVSDTVGSVPRWSHDGRNLVSLGFDSRLVATEVDGTGEKVRIGDSRTIARTTASTSLISYSLIPGTDRLVVINSTAEARTPLTVVSGLGQLLRESK